MIWTLSDEGRRGFGGSTAGGYGGGQSKLGSKVQFEGAKAGEVQRQQDHSSYEVTPDHHLLPFFMVHRKETARLTQSWLLELSLLTANLQLRL